MQVEEGGRNTVLGIPLKSTLVGARRRLPREEPTRGAVVRAQLCKVFSTQTPLPTRRPSSYPFSIMTPTLFD